VGKKREEECFITSSQKPITTFQPDRQVIGVEVGKTMREKSGGEGGSWEGRMSKAVYRDATVTRNRITKIFDLVSTLESRGKETTAGRKKEDIFVASHVEGERHSNHTHDANCSPARMHDPARVCRCVSMYVPKGSDD
jgi:hypothetical protein